MTTDFDQAAARIRDSFDRQTMMQTLGARISAIEPGGCEISAPILPTVRQQHGAAHAGLAFSLGDSAAGYAALTLMPPDQEVMTTEMKINLLAPALGSGIVARGTVVKAGRRLTIVRADVFAVQDGDEKLIAILQGTMIPVPV